MSANHTDLVCFDSEDDKDEVEKLRERTCFVLGYNTEDSSFAVANSYLFGKALNERRLYGLKTNAEDDHNDNPGRGRGLIVPCWMILSMDRTEIEWIYVEPSLRRKGFGKKLAMSSGVAHISCVCPASVPFWNKVGIPYDRITW